MKKLFIFSLLLVVSIFNINAQGITPSKDKTLVKEVALETSHQHVSNLVKDICVSHSINDINNNWNNLRVTELIKGEFMTLKEGKRGFSNRNDELKVMSELDLHRSSKQIHFNLQDRFGVNQSLLQVKKDILIRK